MPTSSTPNRNPAAQPGDRNAFDSQSLIEAEMQSLGENEEFDLLSEIALTRFILARLLSRMHNLKGKKSPRIS